MVLLRKYQLDIVFLFFGLSGILWSSLALVQFLGDDPHDFEWFIAGPLIVLFFLLLIKIRHSIKQQDHRALTSKTLFYWIAFSILVFASYATPLPATDYWSLEIMFILFTVFLADSYWDFRVLTWDKMFSKRELGK